MIKVFSNTVQRNHFNVLLCNMNFLAHIYLSGNDPLLQIGNFIADRVRGKAYIDFPFGIQNGILLHREIDSYTDFHSVFRESKKKLVPRYNHYSGVLVDMFYDHFLAKNWNMYSNKPLEEYVRDFYVLLESHYEILPIAIQKMMPIMTMENWLVKYRSIDGLRYILKQMDSRTDYTSKMQFATDELEIYYEDFQAEFTFFFEEIQLHLKSFKELKGY